MHRRARGGLRATSVLPARPVNPAALQREYFGDRIPRAENYRTHYGKSLDLARIDYAIRSANNGLMRPMTDIARETVSLDGHLSALLQKRLNRLAALDWDVQPATGQRVDTAKAEAYAAFVRAQLEALPRFRDAIVDLAWGVFDARAASELEWQKVDRTWQLTGLHWIHPRRLSFGPHRDVRVIDSNMEVGGFMDVGFPLERLPYKFCIYTPRLFNDYPEREGLGPRALYWSFFARFGTRERMALLELFGKPWRIVKPQSGAVFNNEESGRAAYEVIKALGYNNTARLPPGWDVQIEQPFSGAGQVSSEAIDHASKVLSKLFLGSTGTTDAVSTGLGSSIGDAHLSEEDLVIWSDARRLGEVIEDQITDAIVAVNFGSTEVAHAPRFIFRTEPPISRESELARLKGALELGLPVTLEEAREKLGVQETRDGEPYLLRVTRPAEFGQLAPTPHNEIVYPVGQAPTPGELAEQPAPAINLPAGGGGGAPPAALPPAGGVTPPALPAAGADLSADEDEPDAIAALAEKMTALGVERCEHGRSNRCPLCGVERVRDVEMVDGQPQWIIAWKPIRRAPVTSPALSAHAEDVDALLEETAPTDWSRLVLSARGLGDHVCLAVQPSSVYGTPETLIERGVDETATETAALAAAIVDAVSGKSDARSIKAAIDAAAKRFDDSRIAAPVERELLHGQMLGAMDADFEAATDSAVEVESFTALHEAAIALADPSRDTSFAARPLQEAIRSFLQREVVTDDVFEEMEAAAKRRAFTVARMANEEMVRTVKRELIRQLAVGADLRDFGRHAAERFKSAGWMPASPTHVETIFRTNTLGAYNGGRVRQMSQPEVLESRPFWQVLTVNDGPPRQRATHRAMHGVVLRAKDPFWQEATPPWGYNCRCRIRSLSVKQGAPHVQEGKGPRFSALPDPGFASGGGRLF